MPDSPGLYEWQATWPHCLSWIWRWTKPAPRRHAGEVPVGCVIVRDGKVVAKAGNRTLRDRDPTAHAELLAIRQAAASARLGAAGRM